MIVTEMASLISLSSIFHFLINFNKMGKLTCCSDSPPPLYLQIGNPELTTSNLIKTTKYNALTFIPLATLIQFKRLANVYFLITAILQFIPIISPLSPFSAITPLLFVIFVSLVRTLIEEIGKYRYDRQSNSSEYEILGHQDADADADGNSSAYCWQKVTSDRLKVGHVIRIREDERFPADVILLASGNRDGKAYIQTSSLDGEKNLKNRLVLKQTEQIYGEGFERGKEYEEMMRKPFLSLEEPSEQLYNFNGVIEISYDHKKQSNIPIKISQFLYRDSVLRNTPYIVGVIAYVGRTTKSMMNSSSSKKEKMSRLEQKVNFYMIFIFCLQILLLLVCAILRVFLYYDTKEGRAFTELVLEQSELRGNWVEGAITSGSYFILLNTMIPISLLVSIEIVKFGQGMFIGFDEFMKKGQISSRAFRSSINEELGNVEYIFTDKTGTLTKNQMVLMKILVPDHVYDNENNSQKQDPSYFNESMRKIGSLPNNVQIQTFFSSLSSLKQAHQRKQFLSKMMLLAMSTCHECIRNPDGSYHGPSPDEITLISSACKMGYKFCQNSFQEISLEMGQSLTLKLKVEMIFQFDSDRKRMSIVLSHKNLGGKRLLLCKGADNIIQQRLKSSYKNHSVKSSDSEFLNFLQNCITQLSTQGLRTLLFAYRLISEEQFLKFKQQYDKLAEKPEEQISLAGKQLEVELELMGATGVEDKLQDEVPEVIADLIRANIKVCILTGDKMETAQNIAKSCRLFPPVDANSSSGQSFELIRISQKNSEKQLFEGYCLMKQLQQKGINFGVLIEGAALPKVINTLYFLQLFQSCSSAVCCRITPKNKAEMVELAIKVLKKLTLSIGDGANDVPMIEAANIGIGLYGNQGMNAVQASDFAIPVFKNLWRLVFVHGRWNYLRIAELIKYFFYKNLVFTLGQLWFGYFCAFSGQSIFEATYLVLYNTIFTGGPVLVRALLEQDLNYAHFINQQSREDELPSKNQSVRDELLEKSLRQQQKEEAALSKSTNFISQVKIDKTLKYLFPLLYTHTQSQLSLTPKIFAFIVLESIVESLAIFVLIYYGIELSELWMFSICLYSVVLALVTTKICYDVTYWTTFLLLTFLLTSIIPYILFIYVMSLLEFQLVGTFVEIFQQPDFYLLILLAFGVGSLIQMSFGVLSKYYFPGVVDIVRKEAKKIKQAEENGVDLEGYDKNYVGDSLKDKKKANIQLSEWKKV